MWCPIEGTLCGSVCAGCLYHANDNAPPDQIRLAKWEKLRSKSYVWRLAVAYGNLSLVRRSIPDWVADQVFNYEGQLLDCEGQIVWINDDDEYIDKVFRTEEDPSSRWLSSFLKFAEEPPEQDAQARTKERYMLLSWALFIRYPWLQAKIEK